MKFIAHVFPDRATLVRHLNDVFCSATLSVTYDRTRDVYTEGDKRHCCYVISSRDDAADLLGHVFSGFEKHGDFSHLSLEDGEYVDFMIASRVREEVA